MGPHQVSNVDVATVSGERCGCAEDISFPSIRWKRHVGLGRKMWSWRPSQMGPHQVSNVDVATLSGERCGCTEDIYFVTIDTEYNGPLTAFNCYDEGVT
eukprot:scaffold8868_cov103-Skeletonema_menzelii.AAC.1